jgi:hypothetical protein
LAKKQIMQRSVSSGWDFVCFGALTIAYLELNLWIIVVEGGVKSRNWMRRGKGEFLIFDLRFLIGEKGEIRSSRGSPRWARENDGCGLGMVSGGALRSTSGYFLAILQIARVLAQPEPGKK